MKASKVEELAFKNILYNQCLSSKRCEFVPDKDKKLCCWCKSIQYAFPNLDKMPILKNFKLFTEYFNFDVVSKAIKIRR